MHLFLMLAYIDPTGGLPPPVWGAMLAMIAAAVAATWATIKLFGHSLSRFFWVHRWAVMAGAGILAVLGAGGYWAWSRTGGEGSSSLALYAGPRVLVLGFDGLDPQLLEQYMKQGRLRNFAQLAKEGIYHPLATTSPPQSPVAWASFITGDNPGHHHVFDFIKRDPATYKADLSLADRKNMALPWKGRPLWERPTLAKLGTVAQRLPLVFPPPKLNGKLLAGMGVWDIRGTEGTYFFFTTEATEEKTMQGGKILPLTRHDKTLKGDLPGPYHAGGADNIREPFEIDLAAGQPTLKLQGRQTLLESDRWSNWIEVEFSLGALGLQKVKAITQVLPHFEADKTTIYFGPLSFDPRAPLYPISSPARYAGDLADAIGIFATRGMPFDTHPVNDQIISEKAFLEQVREVTQESEKMLSLEMAQFQSGLLFAYFEGADIVQHMFWWGIDSQHPLYQDPALEKYHSAIPDIYERFDDILGRARASMGKGGTVVVISDHGFGPYRRSIHLNAVLRDLGYLKLKDDKTTGGELLADVDWSRTQAYALGFNAVYLNLDGREAQGIVPLEQAPELTRQLSQALENWTDTQAKAKPIKKVHMTRDIYGQAEDADIPDLIVGYYRGYRASFETALGATPELPAQANDKRWSGDHLIDVSEVPGIFLSSDKALDASALQDVGAAIDKYLEGKVSP